MNDAEWKRFRMEDERKTLLIEIEHALDRVPGTEAAELGEEFSRCLDGGGIEAAYAITEEIDGIQILVFYPVVIEHFIRARILPVKLTKDQRARRVRRILKLADALRKAGKAARDLPDSPRWCTALSGPLSGHAEQLIRLAKDDIAVRNASGPGSPMEVSTSLAMSLNDLFGESKLPQTTRCDLIANVVSAFVEPVTGEQIRQRIKTLRRRPRAKAKR